MHNWQVACPYTEILLDNKKKWYTNTCYDMDKACKHYGNWKMPVTKDPTLYDFLYIKWPE